MKSPDDSALLLRSDYEQLLAFRSILCADGYKPIKRWMGGDKTDDGAFTVTWPEYDETTVAFFHAAGWAKWADFGYVPAAAAKMLADAGFIRTASIEQVKTMLTYCVRGERFCDGHWDTMIRQGHICRLLDRLTVLYEQLAAQEGP